MNWHYVEQGQQAGPVSDEQFAELARNRKIADDTLVWCEGMADWQPYSQVKSKLKSSGTSPEIAVPPLIMAAVNANEAVCNECGKIFPIDEMIQHGSARICVNCKPVFIQKLSEGAHIKTGELNFAPIFIRFCAWFLDLLILVGINISINLIVRVGIFGSAGARSEGLIAAQFFVFMLELGIGIGYEVLMIGKYGATLGKMACKLKVVTADGGRVTYARAFGRYFAKLLSSCFTLMIGYIMAIFDDQKRALHDRICETRVITNSP